jgi:nucleoside-diphosphate-sugar epimerase
VIGPKRVLVTGGRGFIGRRSLERLAARGHEVVAVTHAGDAPAVPGVAWEKADLLEPGAPERLAAGVCATHLLHLAWYTKSPEYWDSELNDVWARASIELVQAFVAAGGRRIVAAGTCAEYAWLGERCVEERTPLRPATHYGATKHRTHAAIAALAREAGIPCAWLRSFFVYGPGEEAGKLVSSSAERIRAGRTIALAQPQRRLDFVHVDDVAEAFAGMVDSAAGGPFNVGTGSGTSIREVVEALGVALGSAPRIECLDAKHEPDVVADTGRLCDALSWRPRAVVEGVRSIVEGYVS